MDRTSSSVRRELDRKESLIGYGKRSYKTELSFTEGYLPETDERIVLSHKSVATQMRQCLENLRTTLHEQGLPLENVLKTTIYLTSLDHYDVVNDVYSEYFAGTVPARSTVGVTELLGGADVQIEAVVVRR
jgi:2-iminobutanoate/2-iminopropanoate deaminase